MVAGLLDGHADRLCSPNVRRNLQYDSEQLAKGAEHQQVVLCGDNAVCLESREQSLSKLRVRLRAAVLKITWRQALQHLLVGLFQQLERQERGIGPAGAA